MKSYKHIMRGCNIVKKGFTLIELMGVIVILAILLLVAAPIYNGVTENIKKSVYESKIREVLAKSETYAEETGKMVFDIRRLIKEGRLTADNELEEFIDPRNGRNMACDIINVRVENASFHASIRESEICYSIDELESMYGMIHLKLVDEEGKEINPIEGTKWLKKDKVYVTYELHNESVEIESLLWNGEQELHCEKENIKNCEKYEVNASSIKSVIVRLRATLKFEGIVITTQVTKEVNLDIQRPRVIDGSVNVNNELATGNNRKVDFEITDGSGSGIKEYALVKEKTCKGEEYERNKKSATDGIQTEYLENGEYYICVEDKVGNRTSDEDLDGDGNKIHVSGIDTGSPVIHTFTIVSRDTYKSLKTKLQLNVSDNEGTENLKMCISNTGYLKDCKWESYQSNKNWDLSGVLDGIERTVYLSIQDSAGNITNREAKYTPYKECSSTKKEYTGDFGSCSVSCGGGVQYRPYNLKDRNTNKVCSTGQDSQTCNTKSCAPTLKRIGDKLEGTIIPLNQDQIVLLKGDDEFDNQKNYVEQSNSWIEATVINKQNQVLFQKRITNGDDAMGYTFKAVRMNDNTIFLTGASIKKQRKYDTIVRNIRGAIVKVSNNDIKVVFHRRFNPSDNDRMPCNIIYEEGNNSMSLYIHRPCTLSCTDYWKRYEFDENFDSFWVVEGNMEYSPNILGNSIRLAESLLPAEYTCQNGNFYYLAKEKIIGFYGKSLVETNRCYISSKDTKFYTYEEGTKLLDIVRYNENKFVQLIRDKNKKYHFYFFKKENETWNVKYVIDAPEYGDLIPISDNRIWLNYKDGLYEIPFD